MTASDPLFPLYAVALDAMKTIGPSKLLRRAENEASLAGTPALGTEAAFLAALDGAVGENVLAARLREHFARWDAAAGPSWTGTTDPKTDDRRALIYDLLELSDIAQARMTTLFPVNHEGGAIVISDEFQHWYPEALATRTPYYWDHYENYLLTKGWDPNAVANLNLSTTRVVERLADPQRVEAYQAKGLVVGYVQSGKTANFTGVIARAIDAGYRLIIVLTGTTDLLRAQTQRRLDKELVGRENLLRGIDESDPASMATVDYYGDPDWASFNSHGSLPSQAGKVDIIRLTTHGDDFKSLQQGIEALDFPLFDVGKPLNDATNLSRVPARIAIVKKNKQRLKSLAGDLKKITARLEHIPALIIDDESDQASVNTSNPKNWSTGQKDRSTINKAISDLLGMLPRGQYIGYTATPFANVFADPEDAADIFPSDFLLSLERPPDYMGAREFHDLDFIAPEDRSLATSNEDAFVRKISDLGQATSDLVTALDAYVLTGAIKLFREETGWPHKFTHHTMLIHESHKQVDHKALYDEVMTLWQASGWYTPKAKDRLAKLYERDFAKVIAARGDGLPAPKDFSELAPFIGASAQRIGGSTNTPAWIINGDAQVAELNLDFDARPVWKVLVGGTKLSRGFTVEGLTISYYRRCTSQADTLMQMGRWFGFRPGYHDLVRLYIGASTKSSTFDLYKAFEAACRAEEAFRDEIRRYATWVDGKPQITPAELHPLVVQYVPWLKPAAANKMYNVQLIERRSPGARLEPTGYSSDATDRRNNAMKLKPLFDVAQTEVKLAQSKSGEFLAYVGDLPHSALVGCLTELAWAPNDHFEADLAWLAGLTGAQIASWTIILPQLADSGSKRDLYGRELSIHERARRKGRSLFGGISDPKHRLAADRIAGNASNIGDAVAAALHQPARGSVLVYPVFETGNEVGDPPAPDLDERDLIIALVLVTPRSSGSPDEPLIKMRALDPTKPPTAMVPAT